VSGTLNPADMKTFYDSPFISSLFRDDYKSADRKLPSYIPAERFADAIFQLGRDAQPTFQLFIERMRQAMEPTAAADAEALRAQCIRYFNESMERVSGWYQRYSRWWLIAIGFAIAVFGNVDTLQIMRTLSTDDSLRQQVVEEATRQSTQATDMGAPVSFDEQRKQLDDQLRLLDSLGLPVGWNVAQMCTTLQWPCPPPQDGDDVEAGIFLLHAPFWSKVFGLLLTTFALSFGAPFWFDVMNQLASLRTSVKPKDDEEKTEEKKTEEKKTEEKKG
jgi:hypothetical protein